MQGYVFAGTIIPDLHPDREPEISFGEFIRLLQDNLSPADLKQANALRLWVDIENLRLFWQEKALDPRGALDNTEMDEAILARGRFPAWVDDYLDEYQTTEERLKHFPKLWTLYFRHTIPESKGFLHDYLTFERGLNLTLAAFRAKKRGRDIAKELQYEDPQDTLVQQILAQKEAKNYVPPVQYEELAPLFQEYGDDPKALHRALTHYRFNKIEELIGLEVFTLDRLLAYMAELFLVDNKVDLEGQSGEEIINKIVNGKDEMR